MDRDLAPPASAFITQVRSAQAKGNNLVIRLSSPDAALLTKLAMPFFQATSLKLPLKTEVTAGYPSAGPYYFAKNIVNELTSLRRNPYWHGNRPRHLAGVDVQWNLNEQTAYQQTLRTSSTRGRSPPGRSTPSSSSSESTRAGCGRSRCRASGTSRSTIRAASSPATRSCESGQLGAQPARLRSDPPRTAVVASPYAAHARRRKAAAVRAGGKPAEGSQARRGPLSRRARRARVSIVGGVEPGTGTAHTARSDQPRLRPQRRSS